MIMESYIFFIKKVLIKKRNYVRKLFYFNEI